VTPLEQVSPVSDLALEGAMLRQHLHDQGIVFHAGVTVHGFGPDTVEGRTEFGDAWSLAADGLVLVTLQRSRDEVPA